MVKHAMDSLEQNDGVGKSDEENEPKLKLDELLPIFRRLPTSELIRLISNRPRHPLGKFWGNALRIVVEERLPLTLGAAVVPGNNCSTQNHVTFDCNGVEIKRPELFHDSPVCALIETAEFPMGIFLWHGNQTWHLRPLCHDSVLPSMPNLRTLSLSFWENADWVDLSPALAFAIKPEVLSQIESLSLTDDHCQEGVTSVALTAFVQFLSRVTGLKRLSITERQLNVLLSLSPTSSLLPNANNLLSKLESLRIQPDKPDNDGPGRVLLFLGTCGELRELELPLRGPIPKYFAAFRALPLLTKLGLDVFDEKTLSVDDIDIAARPPITSVTEFRLDLNLEMNINEQDVLKFLLKLPNVRSFRVRLLWAYAVFLLAPAVCSSRVFKHLQSLTCSHSMGTSSYEKLLQFIRGNDSIYLSPTVDLSQMKIGPDPCGPQFLVDLYAAMECNAIERLSVRAKPSHDAVAHLWDYFAASMQDMPAGGSGVGKALAWKILPFGKDAVLTIEGLKVPAEEKKFYLQIYRE